MCGKSVRHIEGLGSNKCSWGCFIELSGTADVLGVLRMNLKSSSPVFSQTTLGWRSGGCKLRC